MCKIFKKNTYNVFLSSIFMKIIMYYQSKSAPLKKQNCFKNRVVSFLFTIPSTHNITRAPTDSPQSPCLSCIPDIIMYIRCANRLDKWYILCYFKLCFTLNRFLVTYLLNMLFKDHLHCSNLNEVHSNDIYFVGVNTSFHHMHFYSCSVLCTAITVLVKITFIVWNNNMY